MQDDSGLEPGVSGQNADETLPDHTGRSQHANLELTHILLRIEKADGPWVEATSACIDRERTTRERSTVFAVTVQEIFSQTGPTEHVDRNGFGFGGDSPWRPCLGSVVHTVVTHESRYCFGLTVLMVQLQQL